MEVADRKYTKTSGVERHPKRRSPGQIQALIHVRPGTRYYDEITDVNPSSRAQRQRRALSHIEQEGAFLPPSKLNNEEDKNKIDVPGKGAYVRVSVIENGQQVEKWVPDNSEVKEHDDVRYT